MRRVLPAVTAYLDRVHPLCVAAAPNENMSFHLARSRMSEMGQTEKHSA
jgi:hypothetical protein